MIPALIRVVSALAALLAAASASPQATGHDSRLPWRAQWIGDRAAAPGEAGVFHFRKDLDLAARPERFVVRVSADNRYRLFVNGVQVSEGPARGDLLHWRYETVDLAPHLRAGRNVVAATVWNWGELRPAAQISHRTAFLVQGDSPGAKVIDTGPGWKVQRNRAYSFAPVVGDDSGGFYVAGPGEIVDAAQFPWGWDRPGLDVSGWPSAVPVGTPQVPATNRVGLANEWQLMPRNIPPMEQRVVRFAEVRRATGNAAGEGFVRGAGDLVIPANTKVSLLLDQRHMTMGYPVLRASGGAGAEAVLTFAESLFDAKGQKGNRNEIAGKTIRGVRDRFRFDGGSQRRFQTLWLRAFRYVQLDVETAAEPLRIHDLHTIFTAYPFRQRASFTSDAPWIPSVWEINWRVLRLSAFETYWDTPYYEQLQYVGDTRIESLLSLYLAGDDRLMRQAIEAFDHSRVGEGITRSAYPSALPQFIPSFSLWWVAMVHDYWMLRDDPAFVRARLPGTRAVIGWFERQVDASGMVADLPWWNFLDWSDAYETGVPPGAIGGRGTAFTLQFAMVLRQAAELEQALGRPYEAVRYRALADRLVAAARAHAWDGERGLFVDSPGQKVFSQQTNALALLADAVPADQRRTVMERILSDRSLIQASYYFRFYVDEALRQTGLADRYLERLDPWREMVRIGLTATAENPEPSRSDSHAWSAHPNYHLLATVLGIRPGSPGFRTVVVAPALGPLGRAAGELPHPAGPLKVELRRASNDRVTAGVELPASVTGEFRWHGQSVPLRAGVTRLQCERTCRSERR